MVGLGGIRIPPAQVLEDFADDGGLVDDGDEAHGVAALRAGQGIDFIDLVDEPGPVGAGDRLCRGLLQMQR